MDNKFATSNYLQMCNDVESMATHIKYCMWNAVTAQHTIDRIESLQDALKTADDIKSTAQELRTNTNWITLK